MHHLLPAVIFCCTIVYTAAYCNMNNRGTDEPGKCLYNNEMMDLGDSVAEDCGSCTCDDYGVHCCYNEVQVVDMAENCKIVPRDDGCGQKAVQIEDESMPCEYVSEIGK